MQKEAQIMSYYGYMRVSTETQAQKGGGLDVQEKAIRKYAEERGITVSEFFTDAGISGTKESRPALDRLLLETIRPEDSIIVHNTSRLWRDIFAQAAIMKAVMKAGAHIISIDDPEFDVYKYMTDPNNFMISGMMGMIDQWERMTITRKLARGRAAKATNGTKPAGVCPFGYEYAEDKKSVIVNQAEAQLVKFMFTEAQKGRSLAEITNALNGKGYKTRRGNEWTRGSVRAILRNRFYVGEIIHDSDEKRKAAGYTPEYYQGTQPAIISKIQFGKVASQLEKRHK